MSNTNDRIRLVSFYLPQFHPIAENDEWWGKGFTEWRNVAQAKSLFPGHYQPHVPADLGFYDLRLPEAREAQAELAREYGIHGFCYYHYWFNGRRILERPFNEVLTSGKPDFPFCLCWANENWTRVWDGGNQHILLEQKYSNEDDSAHIKSLIPAFRDKRYIRINGKPLFFVYRTELLPDPNKTAEIWREVAFKEGIGEIYLARAESFGTHQIDPRSIGFDASVEFAPGLYNIGKPKFHGKFHALLAKIGLLPKAYVENKIGNYKSIMYGMLNKLEPEFVRFRCVCPSWDNSPRRKKGAHILLGSTPEKYEYWLKKNMKRTVEKYEGDKRIVFINAWNEWAEGNHLEPDLNHGKAYLEATLRALKNFQNEEKMISDGVKLRTNEKYIKLRRIYWEVNSFIREQIELIKIIKSNIVL